MIFVPATLLWTSFGCQQGGRGTPKHHPTVTTSEGWRNLINSHRLNCAVTGPEPISLWRGEWHRKVTHTRLCALHNVWWEQDSPAQCLWSHQRAMGSNSSWQEQTVALWHVVCALPWGKQGSGSRSGNKRKNLLIFISSALYEGLKSDTSNQTQRILFLLLFCYHQKKSKWER